MQRIAGCPFIVRMRWDNIRNGEGGLSVRAKINNAIRDIIDGSKGILRLWEYLDNLSALLNVHKKDAENSFADLRKGVRKSYSYVDKQKALTLQEVTRQVTVAQNANLRNKGFFSSVDALKQTWSVSEMGTIAYVGATSPYVVYKWSDDGGWYNTGSTYNGEPANFHGYPKVGYAEDGNTQLIDYNGESVFPMVNSTGVRFEDGSSLDAKLEEVTEDIFNKCDSVVGVHVFMTEQEYESLEAKDPNKIYFIFEES